MRDSTFSRVSLLRPLFALALAALLPLPLLAQATATIRGVVFSVEGTPVKGATVKAGGATATTDKNGLFFLKVKPGTYDVVASHPKYATDTQKGIAAKANAAKEISAVLTPR